MASKGPFIDPGQWRLQNIYTVFHWRARDSSCKYSTPRCLCSGQVTHTHTPTNLVYYMAFHRLPQLRTVQRKAFHTSANWKALSAVALPKAEQISASWKGTNATGGSTKNFIGGEFVESKTTEWIDVHDPVRLGSFRVRVDAHLGANLSSTSQHKLSSPAYHRRQSRNSRMLWMLPHWPTRLGVERAS